MKGILYNRYLNIQFLDLLYICVSVVSAVKNIKEKLIHTGQNTEYANVRAGSNAL
jgi:hypothetical protein